MEKKILYHYKTRAGYNADKANIPDDALVFIKSDKSIVTHGTEYRYVLPTATASAPGGVKVGYTNNGKNYKVQLDSGGNAFVNVPWTDTNTEYGAMKSTAYGLGKVFSDTVQSVGANNVSATAGRTYGVQKNINGQLVVNVPWANTTYGVATQSANGLMRAADKKKLDGIAAGANNYKLPINITGVASIDNSDTAYLALGASSQYTAIGNYNSEDTAGGVEIKQRMYGYFGAGIPWAIERSGAARFAKLLTNYLDVADPDNEDDLYVGRDAYGLHVGNTANNDYVHFVEDMSGPVGDEWLIDTAGYAEFEDVVSKTSSDERLKNRHEGSVDYMARLAALGDVFEFEYNDKAQNTREGTHTGLSYQKVKEVMPQITGEKKGYGYVNYIAPDLIATLVGAVQQLGKKLEEIKNNITVR